MITDDEWNNLKVGDIIYVVYGSDFNMLERKILGIKKNKKMKISLEPFSYYIGHEFFEFGNSFSDKTKAYEYQKSILETEIKKLNDLLNIANEKLK